MAQNSRGGGYDLATDKKNIGMLASARRAGENPSAPTSIGQLMTPSAGRAAPTDGGNTGGEDVDTLTKRNESFLSDPTVMNQIKQFGMSLAGGHSLGRAMFQAATVPERAAAANAKAEETGLDITQKKLNIAKTVKELTQGKEQTPTELMKLLTEADAADAAGDTEKASMLRSAAYQKSQEFSLANGQIVVPPGGGGGGGNAGDATGANGLPTVQNMPGGKADLEAQIAQKAIADAKMTTISQGMLVNSAIDDINRIVDSSVAPNFLITGFGSNLKYVGGTDAANVDALLSTVKANVGFNKLQEMRNASKTGGALGQVSDYENRLLQGVLASMEQGQTREQFQKNLATIKFLFDPTMIDQRGALSKMLEDKQITADEAANRFNEMYRQTVFGGDPNASATGAVMDITVPPAYVPDEYKQYWDVATNEQKRMMLNDEDRAKFDKTVGTGIGAP